MRIDIPNVQGSGEKYLDVMRAICGDTSGKSMADLCCHHAPYTPQLGFKERTYVDILNRGLDFKEEQNSFIQCDIMNFLLGKKEGEYDFGICSDGIEHFESPCAIKVLYMMGIVFKSQVLFTPLGNHNIEKFPTFDPDTHKSGWTPEILNRLCPYHYAYIVMPNFHGDVGAFFFFHTPNLKTDFERIYNELKTKEWTGLI